MIKASKGERHKIPFIGNYQGRRQNGAAYSTGTLCGDKLVQRWPLKRAVSRIQQPLRQKRL